MSHENNESKIHEEQEAPQTHKEATKKKRESTWNRFKQNSPAAILATFIVFVLFYTIVNIQAFSGLFTSILTVLTPIILGAALAYMLNPLLKLFETKILKKIKNKKLLRGLALLFTLIVAILIVAAFILLLIPQLITSIQDFASKFDMYIETTATWINQFMVKLTSNPKYETMLDSQKILDFLKGFLGNSDEITDSISKIGMGIINILKNTLLSIFIAIYILLSKERLKAQTHKLATAMFTKKGEGRFYKYLTLCHENFTGFFVGKIVDSLIIAVLTLLLLLIFRIPYAPLIATIVGITNIIPVFGPFIGAIPSFLIIFIANPVKAFIFLILILIIQQLDGNVIGPKILGNTTGLSSLGVIVSIVIMSAYFGIIGMIVGVPIFAVLVAVIKEFIDHKLEEKGLSSDTADYYERNSLINPREDHDSLMIRMWQNISPKTHAYAVKKKAEKIARKQAIAAEEAARAAEEAVKAAEEAAKAAEEAAKVAEEAAKAEEEIIAQENQKEEAQEEAQEETKKEENSEQ